MRRTLVELRGELSYGEPKTDAGRRVAVGQLAYVTRSTSTLSESNWVVKVGMIGEVVAANADGVTLRFAGLPDVQLPPSAVRPADRWDAVRYLLESKAGVKPARNCV